MASTHACIAVMISARSPGSTLAINGHRIKIISKGSDEQHDVKEVTKWRDASKAQTLKMRRGRSGRRELENIDDVGEEEEEDSDGFEEEANEEGVAGPSRSQPKRPRIANRIQKFLQEV